jgi:hypothetical protein
MTTTLASARAHADADRATLLALAARETRRFAINPIFLFGVAMTVLVLAPARGHVTEIDDVNWTTAVFLGGFGMIAAFWLTRSLATSEPVVGVTPTTLPVRTAALCMVSIVPFACGGLALLRFMQLIPVGGPVYGAFSSSAQVAILAGQIAVPSLGGPLLGVALGRWVRFPGAGIVALLVIFGWVNLATVPSLSHPDSAAATALRQFAPFTHFTYTDNGTAMTTWRGSPWFFLGWQLALCAIAVLVALLRGAEGRPRVQIIRALSVAVVAALILLTLASLGGFTHSVTA